MEDQAARFEQLKDLTPTEFEILTLRCAGKTVKEIAGIRFRTERVILFHLGNIYDKFGVSHLTSDVRSIELGKYCSLLDEARQIRLRTRRDAGKSSPASDPQPEQPSQRALAAVVGDDRAIARSGSRVITFPPPPWPESDDDRNADQKRAFIYGAAAGAIVILLLGAGLVWLLRPETDDSGSPSGVGAAAGQTAVSTSTPNIAVAVPSHTAALPSTLSSAPHTPTPAPVPTPTPVPTATSVPPTPTVIPTATPVPTAGTVLFEANADTGWSKWLSSKGWNEVSGLLVSDGTAGFVEAPFTTSLVDYAVEAEIAVINPECRNSNSTGRQASLTARGGITAGYRCEWSFGSRFGQLLMVADKNLSLGEDYERYWIGSTGYDLDKEWHTFRLEVRGNTMLLSVDGFEKLNAKNNTFLKSGKIGVFVGGFQVEIRAFRVIAL